MQAQAGTAWMAFHHNVCELLLFSIPSILKDPKHISSDQLVLSSDSELYEHESYLREVSKWDLSVLIVLKSIRRCHV